MSSNACELMLRLAQVTLRQIRLPLREPFRISSGVTSERLVTLVTVVSAEGETGWGECVAGDRPNYSSETVHSAWHAIREWVVPRLLGRELATARHIGPILNTDFRGHRMAKAAVEMACWDLEARTRGVALAALLGGTRSDIATGISLGIQPSPDQLARQAAGALQQGYRRIKLKIKPGADLEYVAAVRELTGPAASLSVDANAAYTPDDTEHLAQLDRFALAMIEQPLAAGDLLRHADLQQRIETSICLDESVTDVADAEDMHRLRSGRIINIKAGRVGGHGSAIAIHDFCRQHDIPVWCGGMLESGVGRAHNVALASLPNFTLPGDVSPSARYWERDIVKPEWTMDEGMVRVPRDRPGLGVEVDLDRVDDLTVRQETLT